MSFLRQVKFSPYFSPIILNLLQTNDRTAQIREAVARYEGCEFIPVRLQDAFDWSWWERVSGDAASSLAEIPVDLSNEGLSNWFLERCCPNRPYQIPSQLPL